MATREQITFQPAFALVLAQHFHDAAVGGDVVVDGNDLRGGAAVGHLVGDDRRAFWSVQACLRDGVPKDFQILVALNSSVATIRRPS